MESRDRLPQRLASIYDYDASGKLVLVWVEDFYLRKECPNCFNMFLKSENQHVVKYAITVRRFYKCPACGYRIRMRY